MLVSLIDGIRRGSRVRHAVNRATSALRVGDIQEALRLLAPVHREAPLEASILTLLAQALIGADEIDRGIALLESAVRLAPQLVDARVELARQLQYAGQIKAALEHLRIAREVSPDAPQLCRALWRPLMETWDWPEVERQRDALRARIDAGKAWANYAAPIDVLLLGFAGDVRRASAQIRASEILRNEHPKGAMMKRNASLHHRLRIGYLSGDFRDHAVTHLARNLFRNHDRDRFEIYAFSYGRDDESAYRKQVMTDADHFVEVRGRANIDIAREVRAAEIDVLIDLAGHTDGSRLSVLAHRPAPVQAHYLGYPATTGAPFVDYYLADPIVAPQALETEFTECFVRLSDCFMISDEAIAQGPSADRSSHGLPADAFVFVNFNQNSRITPHVWHTWMEILGAVPSSVLWLKSSNDLACARLRAAASDQGVDPQRIVFAPDLDDKKAHIARLRLADLGLDTFGRYNGHTSTADALWAGVPVVTTASDCFPGRVAASLLRAAGMAECVASDEVAYKAFAIRFASAQSLQQHIRGVLARAYGKASFFQPQGVVRALERAYEAMWKRYRTGGPAVPIDV